MIISRSSQLAFINIIKSGKCPINVSTVKSLNLHVRSISASKNNVTPNNISEFYKGSNIFITGGTGFVGKVLLEKLLRSCSGIENIYVLLRPKRGVDVDERLKKLLENPVFDGIPRKTDYLHMIKAVAGDVGEKNLGLCDFDRQMLMDKVNVVFHSAASLRLNEDLKPSILSNTLGTTSVTELCKEIKHLKSFVHVSTAYCNPDRKDVEEMVYDLPYDPRDMINRVETLPPDAIKLLEAQLIVKYPNTYTLAKALAEKVVLECSTVLPTAIVRPSIITASWKEPFPGWVDNISGPTGILSDCARGTSKSVVCNPKLTADFIPVDIVANTLITAAWHTAACRSNTIKVYNCTSGQINRLLLEDVQKLTLRNALDYPSKYVSCYPRFTFRTNRKVHSIYEAVFRYLPAYMRDLFSYGTVQQSTNVRVCNVAAEAAKGTEFFVLREWNFHTSIFGSLVEAVSKAEDGKDFNIDLSVENGFHWDCYMKNYVLGIRKYILKDDLSSLSIAKTKLNRLYWTGKAVQVIAVGALLGLLIL